MRTLVTGGAGFIGSHVVDALLGEGHSVAVVDDLSRGQEANLNPKAHFFRMDICSPSLREVFQKERPEVVFHLAARTSVNHSMADPIDDARVNILGSINLLKCCCETSVRQVIYSSTGGALYGEPSYLPCDEDHPINPLSPYGASKHAVEHYLYLFRSNWHLDYTILRYPNVYGPRQDSQAEGGVVAIFADRMTSDLPVNIYGTGKQERDFVYVSDVARGNLLAVGRGIGRAYNLGSGGSISVNELFMLMKSLAGYRRDAVYCEARAGEVFRIYLKTDRVREDLGWQPSVSLKEGLTATIDYYRRRPGKGLDGCR